MQGYCLRMSEAVEKLFFCTCFVFPCTSSAVTALGSKLLRGSLRCTDRLERNNTETYQSSLESLRYSSFKDCDVLFPREFSIIFITDMMDLIHPKCFHAWAKAGPRGKMVIGFDLITICWLSENVRTWRKVLMPLQ